MMTEHYEYLLRLLIASVLGGLVGFERERKIFVAGLRTHMLVCLGAALLMIISSHSFKDVISTNQVMLDPSRIASGVVSGIGFLGAGTIIFYKNEFIKGLTTAAGLWTVAAVGLAIGDGFYILGIGCTILVLIIHIFIKNFEKKAFLKNQAFNIVIIYHPSELDRFKVLQLIKSHSKEIILSNLDKGSSTEVFKGLLKQSDEQKENLYKELINLNGLKEVQINPAD